MSKYDHQDTVSCDYQIHDKCWKTLPPHKGIPHPVEVRVDGQWRKKVKWCCIECEMGFDDE